MCGDAIWVKCLLLTASAVLTRLTAVLGLRGNGAAPFRDAHPFFVYTTQLNPMFCCLWSRFSTTVDDEHEMKSGTLAVVAAGTTAADGCTRRQ